ncbi:MAG: phosphomannomutase [Thermoleophilaceae bacterium]|jgi:phosphomannomutase|nr:phosphomannomutase [Thermoleophilaceae bacterium]
MNLDPQLFRAYDIRGVIPDQLDAGGATQIGRAFVDYVEAERVVVGYDVRLTGPELQAAAIEGILRGGAGVVDIGRVATDEFYFACGTTGLPGVMVTASHNPPEYNGFKLVRDLPQLVMASQFKDAVLGRTYEDAAQPGTRSERSFAQAFDDRMLELVDVLALKPLKVVVDTSNGALGPVWERLAGRLPVTIVPLNFEPDGNFPNHGNDIVQPENQAMLRERVIAEEADLGLIFDPDGDRCMVVDERGSSVPGDFMTALLAVTRLRREPGSTIVYDIRSATAVPDMVKAAGGKPFVWKPGHVYIKPKMQEHDALFGGEVSGHYYFKEFWFSDSGVLAGLTMLEYVSLAERPLGDEVAELEGRYFLSGEINSRVEDIPSVLARVKERFSDGELSELSGVAVDYDNWRFVVRPSDNEPLVRLTVEADSKDLMEAKRDELVGLIRS